MTNPQGTKWETETVKACENRELVAQRLVKQSQKDEADVKIQGNSTHWHIPVVAWKRIVKTDAKVRQPLGERKVVIIGFDDFLDILEELWKHGRDFRVDDAEVPTIWVQNKWVQQISVTKVLAGLRQWLTARLMST